ncbi:hypothetical protein [Streptomyces sp. NPDC007264]|uniref:hypothetical protein n=1 Tax=Streptomyces sp. NPDC007264 TaxID=3364777 RepID=UPI0036DDF335
MVTSAHEGMHRIFQERPEVLAPVFGLLGVPLVEKATVDAVTTDVTEARPLERRVDTVLRVGPSDGEDFLLAIESQSGKDEAKASSWAYYVAFLQAKFRLPVLLLVVCQDGATAKWAAGPFDCGARGWTAQRTYPLVAGPDNVPKIADVRTAVKNLALAVLSVLAHARSADCDAIMETITAAIEKVRETDPETADYFLDFLEISLGNTPAGQKLKEIMSFVSYFPGRGTVRERAYLEGKTEGKTEGKAEGKAEGEAKGVLRVLEVRGLPISGDVRERITACMDLDRLNDWLDRAGTVACAEDLFAEDPEAGGS